MKWYYRLKLFFLYRKQEKLFFKFVLGGKYFSDGRKVIIIEKKIEKLLNKLK